MSTVVFYIYQAGGCHGKSMQLNKACLFYYNDEIRTVGEEGGPVNCLCHHLVENIFGTNVRKS